MVVSDAPTFSTKTQYDGRIFVQLDQRLDGDVLWSQTMKAERYCQMPGLLPAVPAPGRMLNPCQGLGCFLPALHLPLP